MARLLARLRGRSTAGGILINDAIVNPDVFGLQKHGMSASNAVHAAFAYSCLMLLIYTASLPCQCAIAIDTRSPSANVDLLSACNARFSLKCKQL